MGLSGNEGRRGRVARLAAHVLLFGLAFCLSSGVLASIAPPASAAFSYNRGRAVSFANNYWNLRDVRFASYSNDCTNFVSQRLFDGGIPIDSSWNYLLNIYTSPAWSATMNFIAYNVGSRTLGGTDFAQLYLPTSITAAYTTARPGDAVVYNWNNGGDYYDHMSMIVATEWVGTYVDVYDANIRNYGFNYYTDVVDQHTSDRYHVPWNFAFYHDLFHTGTASRAPGEIFYAVVING